MRILSILALLSAAGVAHAFNGTAPIVVQNGNISITSPLPVANGGTNLSTATDDNVMVGNGTTWQSKALTTCTGAGKAVTYDVSTNAFGCNTITGVTAPIFMGAAMDLTTSQTVFVSPVGVDTTEGTVQVPSPGHTYSNLRCINKAIQGVGNNIVVTARAGACGSQADGTQTCTITGSASANQACSDVTNTAAPTAGQCWDYKVVTPATLTASAQVNCSVDTTL